MFQFAIIFLIAALAIFIILKIFKFSVKFILSIIANIVVGLLIIFLLNIIPGVSIPLNWISGIIVGTLGIPGAIIVLIISFIV